MYKLPGGVSVGAPRSPPILLDLMQQPAAFTSTIARCHQDVLLLDCSPQHPCIVALLPRNHTCLFLMSLSACCATHTNTDTPKHTLALVSAEAVALPASLTPLTPLLALRAPPNQCMLVTQTHVLSACPPFVTHVYRAAAVYISSPLISSLAPMSSRMPVQLLHICRVIHHTWEGTGAAGKDGMGYGQGCRGGIHVLRLYTDRTTLCIAGNGCGAALR